jgi:hypothetical protein
MRYPARMNDATMDLTTPDGMARAVAWQTSAMNYMKDGTVWVIPGSLSIVQVYPTKKNVVVRTPGMAKMFEMVKLVFLNMGWTVVETS